MEAPILRVVQQRHGMDCAVACLAMVCCVSYEDALLAVAGDQPDVCAKGVYTKHLKAAAKRLGFKVSVHRKVDVDNDTGILNVSAEKWNDDHLVVLKDGLIVDTDATIWDADVYISTHAVKVLCLYALEG